MSKYEPLWKYLMVKKKSCFVLSFDEIKNILGFPIDHSFLRYKKDARTYGYFVEKISLKEKKITFQKVLYEEKYHPAR